jgi:hypothetical protein
MSAVPKSHTGVSENPGKTAVALSVSKETVANDVDRKVSFSRKRQSSSILTQQYS